MCFEGLLVILNCCLFYVERSRESRSLYQVVVARTAGPGFGGRVCLEGNLSNAGSGSNHERRKVHTKKETTETGIASILPARGYPGEDINLWTWTFWLWTWLRVQIVWLRAHIGWGAQIDCDIMFKLVACGGSVLKLVTASCLKLVEVSCLNWLRLRA